MGKVIANLYFEIQKKVSHYIEEVTDKEVQKAKRNFYKQYKLEMTESEVIEVKKNIVKKKVLTLYTLVFVFIVTLMYLFD